MTMTTPTTETGIVELLPCPFCGSGKVLRDTYPENDEHWIACEGCGLNTGFRDDTPMEDLERRWNARAAMPDSTQLLQTMAGALEEAAGYVDADTSIGADYAMERIEAALAQFRAQEQRP